MGLIGKIIIIVLLIIVILESAFVYWIFSTGGEIIENENICNVNICSEYESFSYDYESKLCSCYVSGELEHQEIVT